MKKVILALAAAVIGLTSLSANAQNVMDRGANVVNVGVGLNSASSNNYFTVLGSWDYGVVGNLWDNRSALSVGAQASFSTSEYVNGFSIGPTLGLHYHFVPQLDTYLRLMLGYKGWSYKDGRANDVANAVNVDRGGFGWNLALGTRYYFTQNFGLFLEVGYGISVANVGVSFKF